MSAPPEEPGFWQIYRDEYRKVSASAATRAFRIVTAAILLIVAIGSRHSSVILIIVGVLAGLLVAGAILARPRRPGTNPTHGTGKDG